MAGLRGPEEQRAALERARTATDLVRLRRSPAHAGDLWGYVVGVGRKWALLAVTREGGYSDGWNAVRVADVRSVKVMNDSFERAVSEQQPWWPPRAPLPLDLDRTIDLLRSVPSDEMVGIEKERERAALWIGWIDELEPGRVWLHQVDPEAHWHKDVTGYRLGAVTRVQLRTEYLNALASVTPDRPPRDHGDDLPVPES